MPIGDELIVEHHAVSYAPSLNALVQLRRVPSNAAPFRVLAVGNPPVASAPPTGTRAGDLENLALLAPLPFAEQELRAIADRIRALAPRWSWRSFLRRWRSESWR